MPKAQELKPELLPCPMCGGTEILVKKRKTTMVECKSCGVVVFNYQDGIERDAIAHWNRRAASSEQQAAQHEPFTQSARDVLSERQRQISAEGWTTDHDDLYRSAELACAAACYAIGTKELTKGQGEVWPFEDVWWNPSDRRRNLIKASALLLAELERIDRAAARASNGGKA